MSDFIGRVVRWAFTVCSLVEVYQDDLYGSFMALLLEFRSANIAGAV